MGAGGRERKRERVGRWALLQNNDAQYAVSEKHCLIGERQANIV